MRENLEDKEASRSKYVMSTSEKMMYEWRAFPWKKIQRKVFKLQKRIYQAQKRGDLRMVRKLQRMLTNSYYAKLLAVRRVTQDNQGKKTAGIDGEKSLNPEQRMNLAKELRLNQKAQPTRRVWIPKPGSEEKRPLGIPTMRERAAQALVKAALEPQWEARFEPNSYGFRPGRSAHDAIEQIFRSTCHKPKWVLDADIAKCFDRISHPYLLGKLDTTTAIKQQIKKWLKAGVMDNGEFFPTEEGTPQGGVVSPLLANIALHGMESVVDKFGIERSKCKKSSEFAAPILIRYADDLVVIHDKKEVIEECKEELSNWLNPIGLELKPSKTRIINTLDKDENGEVGFDFLGFHIRLVRTGRKDSTRTCQGKIKGYKSIIEPSKKSWTGHYEKIKATIKTHRGKSLTTLIQALLPQIVGWTIYFSTTCSKKVFGRLENLTFWELVRGEKRKHRKKKKSNRWIIAKIKGEIQRNSLERVRHTATPIRRHTKVHNAKSPYDGDWVYWGLRMTHSPEIPIRVQKLLKRQRGKCFECELYFTSEDIVEVDHIIPKEQGGKDVYLNMQLLHRHCHDKKTASDKMLYSNQAVGAVDNQTKTRGAV